MGVNNKLLCRSLDLELPLATHYMAEGDMIYIKYSGTEVNEGNQKLDNATRGRLHG